MENNKMTNLQESREDLKNQKERIQRVVNEMESDFQLIMKGCHRSLEEIEEKIKGVEKEVENEDIAINVAGNILVTSSDGEIKSSCYGENRLESQGGSTYLSLDDKVKLYSISDIDIQGEDINVSTVSDYKFTYNGKEVATVNQLVSPDDFLRRGMNEGSVQIGSEGDTVFTPTGAFVVSNAASFNASSRGSVYINALEGQAQITSGDSLYLQGGGDSGVVVNSNTNVRITASGEEIRISGKNIPITAEKVTLNGSEIVTLNALDSYVQQMDSKAVHIQDSSLLPEDIKYVYVSGDGKSLSRIGIKDFVNFIFKQQA